MAFLFTRILPAHVKI